MQYTPGPWSIDGHGGWVRDAGGSLFAPCSESHRGPMYREGRTIEQAARDARLIAAAPDMLQALGELLAECDESMREEADEQGHYRRPDTLGMELARDAIRKATE